MNKRRDFSNLPIWKACSNAFYFSLIPVLVLLGISPVVLLFGSYQDMAIWRVLLGMFSLTFFIVLIVIVSLEKMYAIMTREK